MHLRDYHGSYDEDICQLGAQPRQPRSYSYIVYAAMVQDSSLSSFVPTYLAPWRRLHETELLARLHAKFWHQSMEAEEREWCKNQLENEPMAVVDKQPRDDNIKDTDDEDNEIDAGCYVLQIDIPGLEDIWIRKEYIKLYNCCDDYLKNDHQFMKTPSVVITGQPGIGKCFTS